MSHSASATAEAQPQPQCPPVNPAAAGTAPSKAPTLAFLREFLRAPKELGTCFTSSPALSKAMVEGLPLDQARCVIELGPGTGPLTERILRRIPTECLFFGVELNAGLADALHKRWPSMRIHVDSAENLRAICEREGVRPGTVDAVVSSIPFLLFPGALQASILREIAAVLRPGGGFTTLTYRIEGLMPGVKRFRRMMEREFSQVRLAKVVLANVPPAFVYRCVK